MEKQGYENENIERKYLENMKNHQFSEQKVNLLELEKHFAELRDMELKDRKEKIKRKG